MNYLRHKLCEWIELKDHSRTEPCSSWIHISYVYIQGWRYSIWWNPFGLEKMNAYLDGSHWLLDYAGLREAAPDCIMLLARQLRKRLDITTQYLTFVLVTKFSRHIQSIPRREQCSNAFAYVLLSAALIRNRRVIPTSQLAGTLDLRSTTGCNANATDASDRQMPIRPSECLG